MVSFLHDRRVVLSNLLRKEIRVYIKVKHGHIHGEMYLVDLPIWVRIFLILGSFFWNCYICSCPVKANHKRTGEPLPERQ